MTTLQAIVLGILQGATEFLPISSTAHLLIVPKLLNWPDPQASFSAVIQIGTLIAVVIYFWDDIVRLLLGTLRGARSGQLLGNPDARLAWMIVVGTLPVVVVGLALKDWIENEFRRIEVVAGALIGLALILALAEWLWQRRQKPARELSAITWTDALLIGFAQTLALIPGSSRSGVTITAALFLGFSRPTAARFSFLLSLPAIFGAGVYQLYAHRTALLGTQEQIFYLVLATVISGLVGYASIAFLLRYLQKRSTLLFIGYRIALGILLLALLGLGVISGKGS